MHGCRHIKYTLRQFDAEAGCLVDQIVQELQDKVICKTGFQNLQFADVQISARHIGFLVESLDDALDGVSLGTHFGFILEHQKEPVADGLAGNAEADLFDVVQNFFPTVCVWLIVMALAHLLHIVAGVGRQGADFAGHAVRRDLQIGCVGGDDILLVVGRLQVEVHRQNLQNLDKPVVLGDDHTADDILDAGRWG